MSNPVTLNIRHGYCAEKALSVGKKPSEKTFVPGYLLGLEYSNVTSLGRALAAIKGTLYWISECNTKAVVWVDKEHGLQNSLIDRLEYLSQFNTAANDRVCDKCSEPVDDLYRIGQQRKLLCFGCSGLTSHTPAVTQAAKAGQLLFMERKFKVRQGAKKRFEVVKNQ